MTDKSNPEIKILMSKTATKAKGVFSTLPANIKENLLSNKQLHIFKNGEFLQRYDDEITGIWIIYEGFVRVGRCIDDDNFKVVLIVSPSDSFGELSCFSEIDRPIDAIATGEVSAFWVGYDELKSAIDDYPEVNIIIRRALAAQLQQALDIFLLNKLMDASEKLKWTIRFYCTDNVAPIKLLLSQNELADMVGVSRMTVSKTFKELEDSKIIRRDYGYFEILEPDLLIA